MIFVDFTGLKVKEFSELRKKLKAENCELKVTKKTLMAIAFKKAKIKIEPKSLLGEVALIFGYKEEIPPAKITWQFSQANPHLKILGGFFENKFVEPEKIGELAKLPTREELLARFIGNISAPVSNLVYTLKYNLKELVYLLSRIKSEF